MQIHKWLVYVFSLVMLAACAATRDAGVTAEETVRELTAIANAWDTAIVTKNTTGIEGNMAADFKQIRGSGNVVDREQFLRDITDPALNIDPYEVDDFSVHLLGDTALLHGRIRMTGTSDGERFESHFRYIDVYARRGGRWQVVSVQITPMPADRKR